MMISIFPLETWLHLTNYWKDSWRPEVFIMLREEYIHHKDLEGDNKFMLELYFLRSYQSLCHNLKISAAFFFTS